MAIYRELKKPLIEAGYAIKGIGDGQWKAIAPTRRFTFTNKGFCYRSEEEEIIINTPFIEDIVFENNKLIVINKAGESLEWDVCA